MNKVVEKLCEEYEMRQYKIRIFVTSILLLSVCFMILLLQKCVFHSDDAMFVWYAEQMQKQHAIFPERYHYTTEVFGFGPSFFMVFFVKWISNKILVHEMGSIFFLCTIFLVDYFVFRKDKFIAFITLILFFIPYSWTYNDMVFYQAAYAPCFFWILLMIGAISFFTDEKEMKTKQKIKQLIILFIVIIFMNFVSVRSLFYIIAPLLLTSIIYGFDKNDYRIEKVKSDKTYLLRFFLFLVILLSSFIVFKINMHITGYEYTQINLSVLTADELINNISVFFINSISLYGYTGSTNLLSFYSIGSFLAILIYLLSFWIAPIYWAFNYRKIDDGREKYIIIFCFSSQMIQNIYFLVTGAGIDRYFLTVMFVDFVLVAFMLKYIKVKNRITLILVLIAFFMVFKVYYLSATEGKLSKENFESILNPRAETKVCDYLIQNDLTYGFAKFWTGYPISFSSNGQIEIAAFDKENPLMPYYFDNNSYDNIEYYGCSEDLYNPELHKGRCFILLKNGETIDSDYYEKAEYVTVVGDYHILVYDKNIYEIFNDRDVDNTSFVSKNNTYIFNPDNQLYEQGGFFDGDGYMYILPNSLIKLNYVDLKAGTYELHLNVNGDKENSDLMLSSDYDGVKLEREDIDSSTINYYIDVQTDTRGIQIDVLNKGDNVLKIKEICMNYLE